MFFKIKNKILLNNMSKAYGYGSLNSKYNTLQTQLLSLNQGGSGGSQNLQQVLTNGSTSNIGIELTDTAILNIQDTTYTSTSLNVPTETYDLSLNTLTIRGDAGSPGQVIVSGGSGGSITWGGGIPTISEVLNEGSNANGEVMTNLNELQVNAYVNVNPSIAGIGQSVLRYDQLNFYNPDNTNVPNSTMDINHISIDKPDGVWARLNNFTGQSPTLMLKSATNQLELSSNGFYVNGFGTEGQVLTRTAVDNEFEWKDVASGTQDLQSVLNNGSSASDKTIILTNTNEPGIGSSLNNSTLSFTNDNGLNNKSIDIDAITPKIFIANRTLSTFNSERCIITDNTLTMTVTGFASVPKPTTTITKSIMSIDDGALSGNNGLIEVEPSGISITKNASSVLSNEVLMDYNGFSVQNVTTDRTAYINLTAGLSLPPNSTINLENTAGANGYVITSNGSYASWQPAGSGGWVGTAESNLDMGTYDITSTSGTLNLNATDIQITGQANFVSPPHIPEPILGNDAASKGYVDSLVGQYAGGFNLFMNYTNVAPAPYGTYRELSSIIDTNPVNILVTNPLAPGTQEIARFITEPLNLTEIPVGLWDAFIYGAVSGTAGDVHYFFELYKVNSVGTSTLLGTSGISPDVNSSPNNNPTSYSSTLTISTAISLDLTDRVSVVLYVNKSGVSVVSLSTYFEGNFYSFIQTSLNAGTTLLTSNNNWTGTNNFALNPTTTTKLSPADTDIINYGDIQRLSTPIVSTLNYYISTTSPFFQYPPAPPTTALIQLYQYYGWYFINSVIARKIDWYFAPDYAMTVGDVRGLYMNYINITTTSNDNLPFISIYTKPTGTNDAIPGFAHSVATYIPNFTPTAATPYCSFMNISGTQPDPFPYGHILGGMILSPVQPNPRGEYLSTEEVLAISVGTSSGSAVNQVNFIMSKVGICLEQGNQENILNPQNISEQPTLSTVLAFGSAAGNRSISGVNNLSATSITTPTIDSSTSLSLGSTSALGINVGRASQTTNLLGNVQINSSSGTSGQVLTSTGASTAPSWSSLPTSYISSSGVASGPIDMSANAITNCPSVDSSTALSLGATSALGVNVGRFAQTTNLIGNVRFNNSSGSIGQVLTSLGTNNPPVFQGLPTPYISSAGLASGSIDMGGNFITNCAVIDNATEIGVGTITTTGVNVGRLTRPTNLIGNVQINGTSGTSGQILTSTGASSAPTWQTPAAAALSPSVQNNLTAGAISLSIGIARCRSLDITIVSGAKYLISGSFVVYSSGSAPQQNTTLLYMGIGQQAVTASPSAATSIPITTNTGFMNSPIINEDTCLSTVQFQNYPAEQYTLANTYVWTAPAAAAGSRTFSLWARAAGTITTSIITVNYTLSVTRIV